MPCSVWGSTAVALSRSSRRCSASRSAPRPVKFGFLGGMFPQTAGALLARAPPTLPAGACCGITGLLFP